MTLTEKPDARVALWEGTRLETLKTVSKLDTETPPVGPDHARQAIRHLSQTPWAENVPCGVGGTDSICICALDGASIAKAISALADGLVWGTQIESELGMKLRSIANALAAYEDSGQKIDECRDIVEAVLGNGVSVEDRPSAAVAAHNHAPAETHDVSACACGTMPILEPYIDDVTGNDMWRFRCPDCGEYVTAMTTGGVAVAWNDRCRRNMREYPPCCRCGNPTFPDGVTKQGSDLTYCSICADDMFG